MIAFLQRVSAASVRVKGEVVARCDAGLLVLVGVSRGDDSTNAIRLAQRLSGYRLFADVTGRMNLSVKDLGGGLILVPQFTLAADTASGLRASFTPAAEPARASVLFEELLAATRLLCPQAQAGAFGADMQVALVNDGPVSFWLEA